MRILYADEAQITRSLFFTAKGSRWFIKVTQLETKKYLVILIQTNLLIFEFLAEKASIDR